MSDLKVRPPKRAGLKPRPYRGRGEAAKLGRGDTYLLYIGRSGIIPTL
jgi:hypothetical protein